MQFTAIAKGWMRGMGWREHVLLSCLYAVQKKRGGKKGKDEKKTQQNKPKQQKKKLFYAIFIVKNFSNQKLTSKLATIAQCWTGWIPCKVRRLNVEISLRNDYIIFGTS